MSELPDKWAPDTKGYVLVFRMGGDVKRHKAAVFVTTDGKTFVTPEYADPRKPVVVLFEGGEPTKEQLDAMHVIAREFKSVYNVPIVSLDDKLIGPYFFGKPPS